MPSVKHFASCCGLLGLAFLVGAFVTEARPQNEDSGVLRLISRPGFEGISYEDADDVGIGAVDTLLAVLRDESAKELWPNAVAVLGIAGDASVLPELISVIEREPVGTLTPEEYMAKQNALLALAHVHSRTGDQAALDYLACGVSPQCWRDKEVSWVLTSGGGPDEVRTRLVMTSILALGRAGSVQSELVLNDLLKRRTALPGAVDRQAYEAEIKDALKENKKIRKGGLANYYRRD